MQFFDLQSIESWMAGEAREYLDGYRRLDTEGLIRAAMREFYVAGDDIPPEFELAARSISRAIRDEVAI